MFGAWGSGTSHVPGNQRDPVFDICSYERQWPLSNAHTGIGTGHHDRAVRLFEQI